MTGPGRSRRHGRGWRRWLAKLQLLCKAAVCLLSGKTKNGRTTVQSKNWVAQGFNARSFDLSSVVCDAGKSPWCRRVCRCWLLKSLALVYPCCGACTLPIAGARMRQASGRGVRSRGDGSRSVARGRYHSCRLGVNRKSRSESRDTGGSWTKQRKIALLTEDDPLAAAPWPGRSLHH